MKFPNGYGGIHKLKDKKRRKPWRVRITVGYEYDKEKDRQVQKYKTLGYYETRQKAIQALAEYNENPYDLDADRITFSECYEKWSESYFKRVTVSSQRTVASAYSYCSSLYNMKMRDIRTYHLKECLENGYVVPTQGAGKGEKRFASANTKTRMKSLFNLVFDYAVEHEIVITNYARNFNIPNEVLEQKSRDKKDRIPFSLEEIEKLWEMKDKGFTDMVLIGIYSGWRPQELAILKVNDVNLEEGWMFGGLKTGAGKNRKVPIHSKIRPLVERRLQEAEQIGSAFLFNDENGQQGTHMTYDKYRRRFEKVMEMGGMEHRPHDTRHTFITLAKQAEIDEYVLKLIVGHAITDVTESVYTHREFKQLQEAIERIQ